MNFSIQKSSLRLLLGRFPIFFVSNSSDIVIISGDCKNVHFFNSKGTILETWYFTCEISAIETSTQNELFVLSKDGNIGCINLPSTKTTNNDKKTISILHGEKFHFAYLPGAYKINYTAQGLIVCSYYTPICVYGLSGSQRGLQMKRLSVELSTFDTVSLITFVRKQPKDSKV